LSSSASALLLPPPAALEAAASAARMIAAMMGGGRGWSGGGREVLGRGVGGERRDAVGLRRPSGDDHPLPETAGLLPDALATATDRRGPVETRFWLGGSRTASITSPDDGH